LKPPRYITDLSTRSELLEALDWDEEAFQSLMKDCGDVLSEIKNINDAEDALHRLQTELSISLGEKVANLAITYYITLLARNEEKGEQN
jgi:hypothetical protein